MDKRHQCFCGAIYLLVHYLLSGQEKGVFQSIVPIHILELSDSITLES